MKKLSIRVRPEQGGKRLDQCLAEALPEVSKSKVRKLIVAGAVYLNGKRVRIASKEMLPGARLEAYIDWEKLNADGKGKDQPFQMSRERVLYEDRDLIAVDKPAGLPTQPTLDEARENLFAAVKRFLKERAPGAQDAYLGLHHRLDRDTSGVVLFTKTQKVNAAVAALFSQHRAQKIYQALCSSPVGEVPGKPWVVRNYLGRLPGHGKRARYGEVRSGGDFAETAFRVLGRSSEHSAVFWVEATPKTGRTHQIRVHLAGAGLPILGDDLYGGKESPGRRMMLHAVSLTFPHPIEQTVVSIQSPLPQDFSSCLKDLKIKPTEFPGNSGIASSKTASTSGNTSGNTENS